MLLTHLFAVKGGVEFRADLRQGSNLLGELTKNAETISRMIEREVRRILPSTVTVQANIQFDEGNILVTGTVMLLSWAAPIMRDAAKKELGELVNLAIKRVLSRYILPVRQHGRGVLMQVADSNGQVREHVGQRSFALLTR